MNKLTKKEKGFANDYIDTGNGTQSALKNYDTESENVAGTIAFANLRKTKIQEYIASKAEDASSMIFKLSQNAEGEAIRLNASKDILDRAGYKPVEKAITLNMNIKSIDPTDETIINSLKAIQDKLENE